MKEVEVKLLMREDAKELRNKLRKIGFRPTHRIREHDIYFDDEQEQIRNSGRALRIREITDLDSGICNSVCTCKGPREDSLTMTREEQEMTISDAAVGRRILEMLGYRAVSPAVIKQREEWRGESFTVCLDHVEDLGDFLEIESVVADEAKREAELVRIESVMKKLGYSMNDSLTNSYLSMLQGVTDL